MLRPGDAVLGTAVDAVGARRYVPTPVLAHWSTTKPAHRVTLADGTDAGGQRRAPLPHRAGMAARRARVVPGRAPPPAAPGRRPARSGCPARCPGPDRVLPAGLPARPGPRGHGGADAGPRRPDRPGLPVGAPRAGGARPGPPPPRRRGGRSRSSRAEPPHHPSPRRARAASVAAQARPSSALPGRTEPRPGTPSGPPERCHRPGSCRAGSACVVRPTRTTTGARGCSVAWRTPRAPPPRAFCGSCTADEERRGAGHRGAAPPRLLLRRREGGGRDVRRREVHAACRAAVAVGPAPAAGGRQPGAPAVPHRGRPGGQPPARAGRRRGRRRPGPGGRRHLPRPARRSRCSTSPPAPATSSPRA